MKNIVTTNKLLKSLVASAVAAILTACGGGTPEGYTEQQSTSTAATSQQAPMNASQVLVNKGATGTTGNSSGDFNPDLWSEHSWYECDCSRKAAPMGNTPW